MLTALGLSSLNVVIVGSGAIATALAENFLTRPELNLLVLLRRDQAFTIDDQRVMCLSLDIESTASLHHAAAQVCAATDKVHILINTVGMLHMADQRPEKRLKDLDPEKLLRSFSINSVLLPLLAQSFAALMNHRDPAVLASLSARVGSIEDNRLGGWYSYRASKAAHNMLLKTLSLEWRTTHRNVAVVALHPGTVASPLSDPFVSARYSNTVLTPGQCAVALLTVLTSLDASRTGTFIDWQGKTIPW